MAPEREQSPPDLEHRARLSMFFPGDFTVPWVGDSPTIETRRQYIDAYLNWLLPCSELHEAGEYERALRRRAEKIVVARKIAGGTTRLREDFFEYCVDCVYWNVWLCRHMAPNIPVWPWGLPEENPQDKWSATFATLASTDEVKAMAKGWVESQGGEMPSNESSQQFNLSNAFLVLAQKAEGLRVVKAHDMPASTVAVLAASLAKEEHRDNLHRFQGQARLYTWFCLSEVYEKGDNVVNAIDPHGAGCGDHGQYIPSFTTTPTNPGKPTGQAPVAAPGGNKPRNKKKFQAKPKAPHFVEANKPEPLEASIANQEKPSFAATIGTYSGSKLGPPKGIEDSIWAPSGSASKAAAKSMALPPVAPRLVSTQPVASIPAVARPRPVSAQPAASRPALAPAQQAVETKPKSVCSLSEMAMALPSLQPTNQGQFLTVKGFRHQGQLCPEPSYQPPDRAHREKAWRLALPWLPIPSQGEPFRIELSGQMDFVFLVWGPNCAHWKYIQENFVDSSLRHLRRETDNRSHPTKQASRPPTA
ncbi:uncharacterized protein NECHADRAFT_85155 [Fusarium vanettenii 77-13-4]|uniref:Uncharacterized protein n=1 Tax=Fusarium vanettenii (strain ATCC MYA-4622 / CBS 123669 / FGSC 9596 / NRRL 45880 / 77-13-4) TaxID=660122 RepID=C7YV53_FUSV7|nr:uncharacterized protein NECHADRAFT_85155 [Fusarium vanettenii 77-13-4]EEU44925.1 predicted protein [Fusarium vanettenii 77-13-4]